MHDGMLASSAKQARLEIEGINHLTIPVRDLHVSQRFYANILGAHIVDESRPSGGGHVIASPCPGVDLHLFRQAYGMSAPDQLHPSKAFLVRTHEELDRFAEWLSDNRVPCTTVVRDHLSGRNPSNLTAELHFNDPDGNHLEVDCRNYITSRELRAAPPDPWATYYSWRSWVDRSPTAEQPKEGYRPTLNSLSRITLPVMNLQRAEMFYTVVLGADLVRRVNWGPDKKGVPIESYSECRWGGFGLALVLQGFGQPMIHQPHPHHAFTVKGHTLDAWADHLKTWNIPHVIACRDRDTKPGDVCEVTLFFHDTEGNHLEFPVEDYLFNDRVSWTPYDHWDVSYHPGRWMRDQKDRLNALTAI